jgi:hypothetical protein
VLAIERRTKEGEGEGKGEGRAERKKGRGKGREGRRFSPPTHKNLTPPMVASVFVY